MNVWLTILIPSAIVGLLCAFFLKRRLGIVLAGAIPWFGLLAGLLYQEYFVPYQGGGASMWPIALLFGGTVAAVTGIVTYLLGKELFGRKAK